MKPKIGYLIQHYDYEEEDPDWSFYTEQNVPRYKIEYKSDKVKRIIYWEIEDES